MEQMHSLCHVEIQVTDLAKGKAFYAAVFAWDWSEFIPGAMDAFSMSGQHIGGLMVCETVVPGDSPSLWFKVANVEETLAKVEQAGGKQRDPKGEVPHVGWSASFTDPDGTTIGIVQYA